MGGYKYHEERHPNPRKDVDFKFDSPVTLNQFAAILDYVRQHAVSHSKYRFGAGYEIVRTQAHSAGGDLEKYLDGQIPTATKTQTAEGRGWFDIYCGANESEHAPVPTFTLLLEGLGNDVKVAGMSLGHELLRTIDRKLANENDASHTLFGLLSEAHSHVVILREQVVLVRR